MTKGLQLSKSLYEFDDYRELLRDFYDAAKARNPRFSFRVFSRLAGFQSSGTILKVMGGQKNLSEDGIEKIAKALKLNQEEAAFFRSLVLMNQATRSEEKIQFVREILNNRAYRKMQPLKSAQFHYYSKWYYSLIRELVCVPGFREDYQWIARALEPGIAPEEARQAIDDMLTLGVLKRDSAGRLVQANAHITSGDEVTSDLVENCHREFFQCASHAMSVFPRTERDISSMTLGITVDTAKKLKELVKEFRRQVVSLCSQDQNVETVFLLNMQLFPAVKTGEGSAEDE